MTDSHPSIETLAPPRRRRLGRLAVGAATAALASTAAVAILPGVAHAAPPSLTISSADCDATGWHVAWHVNNNDPSDVMTISSATTTGADTGNLVFAPNPVPAATVTDAVEDVPASTTGIITGHVTYHYGADPDVVVTKSWTIGDSEGGTISITSSCAPFVSLGVAPTTATPGSTVQVTGRCEANTSGFAISEAFVDSPPDHDFAGVGAVPFTTDATGHFSVPAVVATTTVPGSYQIGARCGGANIGITAGLAVVSPVTPTTPPVTADPPVRAVPVFTG